MVEEPDELAVVLGDLEELVDEELVGARFLQLPLLQAERLLQRLLHHQEGPLHTLLPPLRGHLSDSGFIIKLKKLIVQIKFLF